MGEERQPMDDGEPQQHGPTRPPARWQPLAHEQAGRQHRPEHAQADMRASRA